MSAKSKSNNNRKADTPPYRMLMVTKGNWHHASSRIRAFAYIPLIEASGEWKVTWLPRIPLKKSGVIQQIAFAILKRFYFLKLIAYIVARKWEVIFAQKLFLPSWLLFIINKRKIPLIFDFDDAIYLDGNELRTGNIIKRAAAVIISTPSLVSFCLKYNKNPYIITTPVDIDLIRPKDYFSPMEEGYFTIGWMGSSWTTKYLYEIQSALQKLSQIRKIKLLLVGASPSFSIPNVEIEIVPWAYESEEKLLHRMDVGIMPLSKDEWSEAKGGYKLYLYMAAALPIVASPIGINSKIIRHGQNGFSAPDQAEWLKYLLLLHDNVLIRRKQGETGRQIAISNYSYQICYEKFEAILKHITISKILPKQL